MATPVLGFTRKSVGQRILATRALVKKMTGSSVYTTPKPLLLDITASVDLLEANKLASKNGTPAQTTALKLQNKAHLTLMNSLLLYIATTSGGDKQKIEDIGLAVKKAAGVPPKMTKITTVHGNVGAFAGESILVWVSVFGAKYYLIQKSADGLSDWETLTNPPTKCKMLITGLVPETANFYRIAAGNTLGIGGYSDPIRLMSK